jgi:hypothetical protein
MSEVSLEIAVALVAISVLSTVSSSVALCIMYILSGRLRSKMEEWTVQLTRQAVAADESRKPQDRQAQELTCDKHMGSTEVLIRPATEVNSDRRVTAEVHPTRIVTVEDTGITTNSNVAYKVLAKHSHTDDEDYTYINIQ